jgi:hypothetical protein
MFQAPPLSWPAVRGLEPTAAQSSQRFLKDLAGARQLEVNTASEAPKDYLLHLWQRRL